jgi:uncharacterized circularly permuted ATP-grasp superfamily protein/uncharacterized alpha-E superfamily protein
MKNDRPIDEMVDGHGGLRPHWRGLLAAYSSLGPGGVAERVRRLDKAFEDEGVSSVLPGGSETAWRCDPVPLLISGAEFAALEQGLTQRATLLEALLQDLYGAQAVLARDLLPPSMVFANPAWLRPYDIGSATATTGRPRRYLDFYAADLVRTPDGKWRVLADRTAGGAGIGYTLENRRLLSRVMPEAYRGAQVRPLQPFFDAWSNALLGAGQADGHDSPAVALLTPGTGNPHWFEHMLLARTLSCALVEAGDLTVRGGVLFVKTLQGLNRLDVLLRRTDGRMLDPLELDSGRFWGITGLMDAMRAGNVRITNDPGSGAVEAPALAAWLPDLCQHLLGEPLRLSSLPTLWLGDPAARARLAAAPSDFVLRASLDGKTKAVSLATAPADRRAELLAQVAEKPWAYALTEALPTSVAPSAGAEGLEPRPIVMRMFLVYDGRQWRMLEGGIGRVQTPDEGLAGGLKRMALCKDIWVMADEPELMASPRSIAVPPMPIRRTSGDLPSRVADNLFWLGRYVERLEGAARLARAALARADRDSPMPHELAELMVLARCLRELHILTREAAPGAGSVRPLADGLLASVKSGGAIADLFAEVRLLTELARDRLTIETYAAFTQTLRAAETETQQVGRDVNAMARAMTGVVRFSALFAGVAAESMVRGGGWLFLELGRRIERAMTISLSVADCMDMPPLRVEAGLRLALELCDSAITYRNRYLTVMQAGPALDLVLCDRGNPRGLAFQLAGIKRLLEEISGQSDIALPQVAGQLLDQTNALVQRIITALEPEAEAARIAEPLRAIGQGVMALSDRVTRRYFALLPAAQAVGVDTGGVGDMRGAA